MTARTIETQVQAGATAFGSRCRFCNAVAAQYLCRFGHVAACESYLSPTLNQMEPFYPLHVYVCEMCSWCS